MRTNRLLEARKLAAAERELEKLQAKSTESKLSTLPKIVGNLCAPFGSP